MEEWAWDATRSPGPTVFTGSAAAKLLRQLSGGRIGDGLGLVLRLEVVLKPGSQTVPPIAPQGI
jgi:hypothetical protein